MSKALNTLVLTILDIKNENNQIHKIWTQIESIALKSMVELIAIIIYIHESFILFGLLK